MPLPSWAAATLFPAALPRHWEDSQSWWQCSQGMQTARHTMVQIIQIKF